MLSLEIYLAHSKCSKMLANYIIVTRSQLLGNGLIQPKLGVNISHSC